MASKQDQMEGMADRKLLLFSVVLLIVGMIVYLVATLFHAEAGVTPSEVFASYANSPIWIIVHDGQFAGYAFFIFGLLALSLALNIKSGIMGLVNRFAAASAVAALALNGVLYAVDGVALKQVVDAWVSAPASEQAVFFAVVQGIRGIEWGMRSYVYFAMGISLVLFAIAIVSTRRITRPIGYIIGLSGMAYIAEGYGLGTGYTSISERFVLGPIVVVLPIIIWTIWLLISAYRMKASFKDS